ncbi:Hypothetical protein PHPALM_11581, partial [Phytophthora palmivora]
MTRPRTAGTGRRQTKYIRFAVDYTHKSRILDRLAEEVKVATVIEEFYPSISKQKGNGKQISKLKGQAGFIQNVCDEGKGHLQNYCRNGDATVLSAEAENDIVLWLNSIWKEGCPVSTEMLELKALEIAADTGIDPDVFSASYSWRRRFMRKHKLSIRARTRQGQTTPDDAAAARAKFKGEVRAAILKHNISNVFNADQTLSSLDIFLALQSQKGGQKMVWVKCSGRDKERATVMLLADWHGNKRAPFLVFKSGVSHHNHVQDINDTKRHGFGVRLWHEISQLQHQHGCQIYGNISACWNAPISLKVSEYHFGDRDDMDEKILLLWDDFSGHWTQALMEYAVSISVILLKLPPRNAYVCKSADVAWNQPFKPCICSRLMFCHFDGNFRSVMKDQLTHFCELFPCVTPTAFVAAEALSFWCARYGVPEMLVSDQGSHFRNETIKHLCARMKIQQEFSPVYSPWLNGTVERLNMDVLQVVRALLLEYNLDLHEWPYLLPVLQSNLNHTPVRTLGQHSPVELFMGLPAASPLDAMVGRRDDADHFVVVNLDNVAEQLESLRRSLQEMHREVIENKERRRLQDMAAHKGTPANFDVGDFVLWSRVDQRLPSNKLLGQWLGPFKVVEANQHSFLIKHLITGREYDVHASRLRFYCDENLNQSAELLELVSSQGIMLGVEAIRDHRYNQALGRWELLVSWVGLQAIEDSWEPFAT